MCNLPTTLNNHSRKVHSFKRCTLQMKPKMFLIGWQLVDFFTLGPSSEAANTSNLEIRSVILDSLASMPSSNFCSVSISWEDKYRNIMEQLSYCMKYIGRGMWAQYLFLSKCMHAYMHAYRYLHACIYRIYRFYNDSISICIVCISLHSLPITRSSYIKEH